MDLTWPIVIEFGRLIRLKEYNAVKYDLYILLIRFLQIEPRDPTLTTLAMFICWNKTLAMFICLYVEINHQQYLLTPNFYLVIDIPKIWLQYTWIGHNAQWTAFLRISLRDGV